MTLTDPDYTNPASPPSSSCETASDSGPRNPRNCDPERNRLYLYICQHEPASNYKDRPPLLGEKLEGIDLQGAADLVAIAFSLAELPRIKWNHFGAWIEAAPPLFSTMFVTGRDFLEALTDIQDWLSAWSGAPDRRPDTTPAWAAARNIDQRTVEAFARSMLAFSRSRTRTVSFCGMDGTDRTISIPPRDALSLPRVAQHDTFLRVAGKENTAHLQTPTGDVVCAATASLEHVSPSEDLPLRVDPRRLKEVKLTLVDRFCPQEDERSNG